MAGRCCIPSMWSIARSLATKAWDPRTKVPEVHYGMRMICACLTSTLLSRHVWHCRQLPALVRSSLIHLCDGDFLLPYFSGSGAAGGWCGLYSGSLSSNSCFRIACMSSYIWATCSSIATRSTKLSANTLPIPNDPTTHGATHHSSYPPSLDPSFLLSMSLPQSAEHTTAIRSRSRQCAQGYQSFDALEIPLSHIRLPAISSLSASVCDAFEVCDGRVGSVVEVPEGRV